jgi:hypothetical protein
MQKPDRDSDWAPLFAALVWIIERDASSYKSALRNPSTCFSHLGRSAEWGEGKDADFLCKMAWDNLRKNILARTVRVRGSSYDEVVIPPKAELPQDFSRLSRSRVQPIGWLETEYEDEGAEDEPEPSILLPLKEMRSLILDDSYSDPSQWKLRPPSWPLIGGRGWSKIEVSRVDLAKAYAATNEHGDGESEFDNEDGNKLEDRVLRGRDYKLRVTMRAIKLLWPDGNIPGMPPKALYDLIRGRVYDVVRKNTRASESPEAAEGSDAIFTIGDATIKRALKALEDEGFLKRK